MRGSAHFGTNPLGKIAVRTAVLLALFAAPVQAADFSFCWIGGGGYTMAGTMTVPDDRLDGIVTEEDVTAFRITGFREGRPIGAWDLTQRTADTTFHLRFDPRAMAFPMGGDSTANYQAWNADGTASNCGAGGFGFNAGNNAQDICLDNTWITASMVNRYTPLTVIGSADPPPCPEPPLLSRPKH